MDLKKKVNELAVGFYTDALAIRRHLHKNPELSFQEPGQTDYTL